MIVITREANPHKSDSPPNGRSSVTTLYSATKS
jgi:hypothetical protein